MNSIDMPSAGLELGQKVQDLRLDRDVERRRGLVGDQEVRPVGERHGDHHPLPLPAGKLVRIGAEPRLGVLDADLVQQLEDAVARRLPRQALVDQQAFGQLLFQRVERVERRHRLLEDEADAVAADLAQRRLRSPHHLVAHVADRPADGRAVGQERHGRQRRHGLARPRFADERHGLSPATVVGHAAHRVPSAPSCRKVTERLSTLRTASLTGRSSAGRRRRGCPRR
jgi:hypothetical protein